MAVVIRQAAMRQAAMRRLALAASGFTWSPVSSDAAWVVLHPPVAASATGPCYTSWAEGYDKGPGAVAVSCGAPWGSSRARCEAPTPVQVGARSPSPNPGSGSQVESMSGETSLEITKHTLVSDILAQHGDIAEVMELFGVKRVGGFAVRKVLGRFLTVERAAAVHRVPLSEFLPMVRRAVARTD